MQETRSEQGRRRKFLQFLFRYQAAMRQFARKQQTWFRNKEPEYWWLVREPEDTSRLLAERIADKYLTEQWKAPSLGLHKQRAAADLSSNKKINQRMYLSDASVVLFADEAAVDAKISDIREAIAEVCALPSAALYRACALASEHCARQRGGGDGGRQRHPVSGAPCTRHSGGTACVHARAYTTGFPGHERAT